MSRLFAKPVKAVKDLFSTIGAGELRVETSPRNEKPKKTWKYVEYGDPSLPNEYNVRETYPDCMTQIRD